jgi:predicted NodU family carbamoyl transferase
MLTLGLSNMRDAAAALVENGRVIAAAEEERFVRIKHVSALPVQAIRFCLQTAGIRLSDVDAVAVPWKYWQLGRRATLAIGSMLRSPQLFRVKGSLTSGRNSHFCGPISPDALMGPGARRRYSSIIICAMPQARCWSHPSNVQRCW